MTTVNLYDVLNISSDSGNKEIREAYRKLAKEFHPDKPGGDEEMFELITHAYNVLIKPATRSEYDELYKLSKQAETDHFDLKSHAINYSKAQETEMSRKSKKEQEIDFKKACEELDRKHGYKRDIEEGKIPGKDTVTRLQHLQLARELDDIEDVQETLFDNPHDFNLAKFNAAWDAMHKGHTELIQHNGNPDAWNTVNGILNFSNIDNYEQLYAEDDDPLGTSMYGSVKLDVGKKKKLTKADINQIPAADYVKGHSYKEGDYTKTLDDKIREGIRYKEI